MTITTDPTFDLVCVPGAIAPGERAAHFLLGHRLFAKLAEERIDLPSGIALRLAADNFFGSGSIRGQRTQVLPFSSHRNRDRTGLGAAVAASYGT